MTKLSDDYLKNMLVSRTSDDNEYRMAEELLERRAKEVEWDAKEVEWDTAWIKQLKHVEGQLAAAEKVIETSRNLKPNQNPRLGEWIVDGWLEFIQAREAYDKLRSPINPFYANPNGWAYAAWNEGYQALPEEKNPYEEDTMLTETWQAGRDAKWAELLKGQKA